MYRKSGAWDERSVASIYQDKEVAQTYIQKRFSHSWSRLLHRLQVEEVRRAIQMSQPEIVLEIAPGPARIATELHGICKGVMFDYSEEMLAVAQQRLVQAGLNHLWELQIGNAFELGKLGRKFDFLYTFRFIRHFRQDERARLYQGMSDCLQSQGLVMFDVVNQTIRQKFDRQQSDHLTAEGELSVYDKTYTPRTFQREMQMYGFEVVNLKPVISNFNLQTWISFRFDHRMPKVSNLLVCAAEKIPSAQPLEWIALCRKAN